MNRLAVLASCLVVVVACDKKDDAKPAGDKPGAAAPAKPAIGLNAPGNDPKIVELAKKALECQWKDQVFDPFDRECPGFKAWTEEKALFADKKGEPTLVNFIEDTDDKVRYLGAKRLADDLGELTDKALVARVLTVAEKSKVQRDWDPLGTIVGNSKIDSELFPRVKAIVTAPETHPNMRLPILKWLVSVNPDSEEIFNLTKEMAKNTTLERAGGTAMEAFLHLKTDKPARCDVWKDIIDNPPNGDAGYAAEAMTLLVRAEVNCQSHYDATLKALEDRVKAKTATSTDFPNTLRLLCPPKGKASPAQVKKAVALAHKLAEDKKAEADVRSLALDASAECDPKGKKAFLGKFKKDPNEEVKKRAEFLLSRK